MVKRGYLQRTQAEDDRRSVRIRLSDYCYEKTAVLDAFFRGISEKIAAHIPSDEFQNLVEKIEKLSTDFETIVPSEFTQK